MNIDNPCNMLVESLLDIEYIKPLSKFVSFEKVRYKNLDNITGVYAFWFLNKDRKIKEFNRRLQLYGVNHKPLELEWNWNLDCDYVLLYVGKTLNLKKRIAQHLMLGTKNWNLYDQKHKDTLYKKNTSCQLRSGLEHLIKDTNLNAFTVMKERIGLSFVDVKKLENRFYAENLAIGNGRPWFNVDSER